MITDNHKSYIIILYLVGGWAYPSDNKTITIIIIIIIIIIIYHITIK